MNPRDRAFLTIKYRNSVDHDHYYGKISQEELLALHTEYISETINGYKTEFSGDTKNQLHRLKSNVFVLREFKKKMPALKTIEEIRERYLQIQKLLNETDNDLTKAKFRCLLMYLKNYGIATSFLLTSKK